MKNPLHLNKKTKVAGAVAALAIMAGGSGIYFAMAGSSASSPAVASKQPDQPNHQNQGQSEPKKASPIVRVRNDVAAAPNVVSDQVVIVFKHDSDLSKKMAAGEEKAVARHLTDVLKIEGVSVQYAASVSDDIHAFRFVGQRLTSEQMDQALAVLASLKDIEATEENKLFFPVGIPNDTDYQNQWNLKPKASDLYSANVETAWDKTQGLETSVIAVVDTGITSHSDLNNKVLPGYNFISDAVRAGNGVGRSADAADLGDWVSAEEAANTTSPFHGCPVSPSSWHGTHVAGIAAASTNNSAGVAGVNWNAKILPVRVMGKCGGYMTDIIAGMRWAAGLTVRGIPENPNPAKVINLSLGALAPTKTCSIIIQGAILEVLKKGALVVAAAGNENADARTMTPANCAAVVTVGATAKNGDRAWYSNYGGSVKISAPGGDKSRDGNEGSILSTLNAGDTTPAGEAYAYYQGTSMAAPHVAGAMALVTAINPNVPIGQVADILVRTATPFPEGSLCKTNGGCGAGILNVAAAVGDAEVLGPDFVVSTAGLDEFVIPGLPTALNLRIGNAGTQSYIGPIKLKVYLSTSKNFDNTATFITEIPIAKLVTQASSESRFSLPLTIPKVADGGPSKGVYYAHVVVNEGGTVSEKRVDNNTAVSNPFNVVEPEFEVTKGQWFDYAPTVAKFTVLPKELGIFKYVRNWKYTFTYPTEGVSNVVNFYNTSRASFDTVGSSVVAIRVESPRGVWVKELTSNVTAVEPPPFTATTKFKVSNVAYRDPLTLMAEPAIKGGHPLDKISSIAWSLDNGAMTSTKWWGVFPELEEGKHTVNYTIQTKFGRTITSTKEISVQPNKPPTCKVTNYRSATAFTFSALCSDSDGKIKSLSWDRDGVSLNNYTTRVTVPVSGTGSMTATVTATDDSGATGTGSATISY